MRVIVWLLVTLATIAMFPFASHAGSKVASYAATSATATDPVSSDFDSDDANGYNGAACMSNAMVAGAWEMGSAAITWSWFTASTGCNVMGALIQTVPGTYFRAGSAVADPMKVEEPEGTTVKLKEAYPAPLSAVQPVDTAGAFMNFDMDYDSLASNLNLHINGTLKVRLPSPSSKNYHGSARFEVTVVDSATVTLLFEAWCQVDVAQDGSVTEVHSANLNGSVSDASTTGYAVFTVGYTGSVGYSGAFDDLSPLLQAADSERDAIIPEIVINEILYNPTHVDSADEWVELYNAGPDLVDLTGWMLTNAAVTDSLELPPIALPGGAYLVIRLQAGPDDFDFTDGRGLFSAGSDAPIFGNDLDACALYLANPDSTTMVDFAAWSAVGIAPYGRAMDHAGSSGHWPLGAFLDTGYGSGTFVEPWTAGPGETIGRDGLSTDSNTPEDWSDSGGADALAETEGRANRGPYFLGEDLVLIAQSTVNQLLWDFALNVTGASHTGTGIVETETDVVTNAIHTFEAYSRVDGLSRSLSGEIICHWQQLGPASWQLDIAGMLVSTLGSETFGFTTTMVDSVNQAYALSALQRVAGISYATPLGISVEQNLDFYAERTWMDPMTLETVDERELNDSRGISMVRSTHMTQMFPMDADEEVMQHTVTTYSSPPGAPTEYFDLGATKHHYANKEIDGVMHTHTVTTNGNSLQLEYPSSFTWTRINPDSMEFDHAYSIGCPSHGYETATIHGTYGAAFDPSGEFIVRGHMTTSLGAQPPLEITYYADNFWEGFSRVLSAGGWIVGCAAGVVATAPSIGGALVVGAACGVGLVGTDKYIEDKCKDKASRVIALQDDTPPPLVNFPRIVCCVPTAVDDFPTTPKSFSMVQNHPNPFNPFTTIQYDLPVDCEVTLEIYDVRGQKVVTLVNEFQSAGARVAAWNGVDEKGASVSSGIYFYRITAGSFTDTKKMILLR